MEMSRAIIIKNEYPQKGVLTLLDQSMGVIACRSDRYNIARGTLIEYKHSCHGIWNKAREIEMIALPCCKTVSDLLFVHRALEICAQFILEGSVSDEVFDLMCYLYNLNSFSSLQTSLLKKIFLCKMFIVIGVWPVGERFQKPLFYRLATESIDNLLAQPIQLRCELDLDGWLRACVASHPHANDFKTWHFLQEKR
jgi:hypothetical protein